MTEVELKKQFIDNVTFDRKRYNQFIKDCVDSSIDGYGFEYEDIVSYGVNVKQEVIDEKALEPCMKSVYNQWYKSMLDYVDTHPSNRLSQVASEFLKMEEFAPETAEKQGYLKTLINFHEKVRNGELPREGKEFRGVYNQNFFNYEKQRLGLRPGFLHMFNELGNEVEDIDVRLYLNIKMENLPLLSKKIYDKFDKDHFPLYFKISGLNDRNDNVVVYTNYQNAQHTVELLKEIKKENPKLFEGAENISPLLGRIDNFIGFGEEPKHRRKLSFNMQRESALLYVSKITDKFLMRLAELDKQCKINNKIISNKEMLSSSIKEALIKRIESSIENYSKKDNPDFKKRIPILKRLEQTITKLNDKQFDVIAKRYSDETIQQGRPIKYRSLPVSINDGGNKYTIRLRYNEINSMLFHLYNDYKEAIYSNAMNSEEQKYYFKEAHVSIKKPFLTTETQQQLDELENQEEHDI